MAAEVAGVAALLLAGGQARRMGGGDKCLLELAGRPLLAHTIARIRPQVGTLALNANGDPDRFADFGLPVLADAVPGGAGPLAGILTGMEWLAREFPETTRLLTVPTDAPFLPADLVARLADAGGQIACAASGGRAHPPIALWDVGLAADLRHAMEAEDMRKIDRWTARHGVAEVAWLNQPFDPFFNVNRPDDLAAADRVLVAANQVF
jgi:molybdopterin-guanine dinucleotide biosynthesis protein A